MLVEYRPTLDFCWFSFISFSSILQEIVEVFQLYWSPVSNRLLFGFFIAIDDLLGRIITIEMGKKIFYQSRFIFSRYICILSFWKHINNPFWRLFLLLERDLDTLWIKYPITALLKIKSSIDFSLVCKNSPTPCKHSSYASTVLMPPLP